MTGKFQRKIPGNLLPGPTGSIGETRRKSYFLPRKERISLFKAWESLLKCGNIYGNKNITMSWYWGTASRRRRCEVEPEKDFLYENDLHIVKNISRILLWLLVFLPAMLLFIMSGQF